MMEDNREKELNILVREYLIKQKCFTAAAHFSQEIGLENDNDDTMINNKYTLQEIFEEHNNVSKKRKIANDSVSRNNQIIDAFQLFVTKYGHGDVPHLFSIDINDEEWPERLRGLKLGGILRSIRLLGLHKEIHKQLTDLGFSFQLQRRVLSAEQVYDILVIYKRLNNDCIDIKVKYLVPESSDYPEYAWGYALGRCVNEKIKKGSYLQLREKWEELGIALNKNYMSKSSKDVAIDQICEAIECYKAIHGHLNTANSYTISADSAFPSHLHGIRLGTLLYNMRHSGTYVQHKDRLLELGVVVAKRTNVSMRGTGKVL